MTQFSTNIRLYYTFTRIYVNICSLLFLYFLLIIPNVLLSQLENIGKYQIHSFSKTQYNAGTQNWGIDTLPNGHILFANNSGLLEYDGVYWKIYTLPNNTIVRSLKIAPNGRIYVGGQDELGYFLPDESGSLKYVDIKNKIPNIFLPLEDVWQLQLLDNKLYCRSINRVYVYDEITSAFDIIDPKHTIISVFKINKEMYYSDMSRGIVSLRDTDKILIGSEYFIGKNVLDSYIVSNDTLLFTENSGIFKYNNGKLKPLDPITQSFLIKNKIASIRKLTESSVSIGTLLGGLILLDQNGNITKQLDKKDGLINNTIHSQLYDRDGNLWLGTANGVNKLNLSSNITIIQPENGQDGAYYGVAKYDGKLYLGSTNGLFYTGVNKGQQSDNYGQFDLVSGSEGQVWGLDTIGNELFMGHNNGAYTIRGNKAIKLSNRVGAWMFVKSQNQNEMYVGTYQGIDIYKKQNGSWTFFKKLTGFNESSRIVISINPNEVWVSHPYRGVYRIQHTDEYDVTEIKLYSQEGGLPSLLLNYVFDIKKEVYVSAKRGIYKYNPNLNEFDLDYKMNQFLDSNQNVRRLKYFNGDIWFVAENEVGVIKDYFTSKATKIPYVDLVGKFVGGFEKIQIMDTSYALACSDEKLLLLNLTKQEHHSKPSISINEVRLTTTKDSLLYGGYSTPNNENEQAIPEIKVIPLKYYENALRITFSSLNHLDGAQYSHRLIGRTKDAWSMRNNQTDKEYNNLRHGNYTFQVKSISKNGIESDVSSFQFEILPPWYLTTWSYLIYFLLFVLMMASIVLIPNKKYQKEKQILTTAKEETEEALDKVINEKLQSEIDFKNTELASSTMHLVQKNETITKIRSEIENVKSKVKDPDAKKELKKIISLLSDDERLEDDWENFSYHFDQVHTDFIKRLSQTFSQLTPKDIKLSAYLRMNLTTKDIAPLLNISVRGVEISRYRLRKKINLESETNLNEFMMSF